MERVPSVGPSVFGPLQLLQLTVVFGEEQRGQPNNFPANFLAVFNGEEEGVRQGNV